MSAYRVVLVACWVGVVVSAAPDPDLTPLEPRVAGVLGAARQAAAAAPGDADGWGRLGAAYDAHDLVEEATWCYRRAAELAPDAFLWRYFLGVVRERNGADLDEVRTLFKQALRLKEDYAPLHLRLGLALSKRGAHAEARDVLERAVALDPSLHLAQRALGQVRLALGDAPGAIEALGRAVERMADDAAAYSALAQAYARTGATELAHEAADRAARLESRTGFPDPLLARHVTALGASAQHEFNRARDLLQREDYHGAIERFRLVESLRPGDADVKYFLGVCHARLDQDDQAAQFSKALDLKPDHLPARIELAGRLEAVGLLGRAAKHYAAAHEHAPDDPAPLARLARLQIRRDDLPGLIASYDKLAALLPHDARIRLNLGTAFARAGMPERAAVHFREALRIDPGYADARRRLDLLLEPAAAAATPKPREEFERVAERLEQGHAPYLGTADIHAIREELDALAPDAPRRVSLEARLARRLLETGDVDLALTHVASVTRGAAAHPGEITPEALHRLRALAYLRQAEVQNCVLRHNADCCIFPLEDGGVHAERGPAAEARKSLLALLAMQPDDLGARWLLNVVSMALGDWPQDVPQAHRLPSAAFDSAHDIGRFRDIAPRLGADTFNLCGGAIVEDFDADGLLDIVTSTSDPRAPLVFYRSDGRGTFEDRSRASRLDQQLGGLNIVGADYDNDGDVDLLVLRGAWLFDHGRIRNSLLRNERDGTFTDVTREAGLARPAFPTQAAAWSDFDNDGDLDLYVCNESRKYFSADPADFPSQLWRNNGNGTFTDIAEVAGVTNDRYCKGVTAGDYDNDADVDLYVSNIFENRLYRNNGNGTFTDVARSAGVVEPAGRSFATWFFDYDNDGLLDLFVAAFEATVADLAAESLGRSAAAEPPRLYRNRGNGTFEDVTRQVGLDRAFLPMGASFGDLDNDGFLDVYLATGDPGFETLMPNVMLRNDAGRRFQDVTRSGGFGHLQKGHGVAFADLDNDGDWTYIINSAASIPEIASRNALFENPGHDGRWLIVRLVGTRSNRAAYGARLRLVVERDGEQAEIHRAVGSVSSFGGSPSRQFIGLGTAAVVKRLEVFWPRSGQRQVFEDVEADQMLQITEGSETLEPIRLRRIRLGG